MKKLYYKTSINKDHTLIFIPKLTQDCIDFNLDCFLQETFENCYELNDIDVTENDLSYMNYLKDKSLLILRDSSKYLCFGTIDLKPSLNGVGFSLYLSSEVSPKRFRDLFHSLMPAFLQVIISQDMYKNYRESIYFDVASLVIYKWAKKILPNLNKIKIKKEYIICYTTIDVTHIKNIILKDIEIYKC